MELTYTVLPNHVNEEKKYRSTVIMKSKEKENVFQWKFKP